MKWFAIPLAIFIVSAAARATDEPLSDGGKIVRAELISCFPTARQEPKHNTLTEKEKTSRQTLKAEGSRTLDAVAISADGKVMVQADQDTVYVWDLPAGKLLRSWKWSGDRIGRFRSVALAPDGKRLAASFVALYHGDILVYDTATGKPLWKQKDASNSSWLDMAFSPDGKRLVSTGNFIDESLLRVWDAADGKFQRELKGRTTHADLPIPFAPDGKTVVALSGNDRLIFWDIETGKASPEVRVALKEDERIGEYVFAPDGKVLAIRSDKSLFLWDRANAKRLREFADSKGQGSPLQFAADGSSLLGFTAEGLVAWDVKTGVARTLLKIEYSHPQTFSPDRKKITFGFDVYPLPE
jgi:WD40 repeat protein